MKRLNLILLLFGCSIASIAQINFEQVVPLPPAPQIIPVFEPMEEGTIVYADVDGINGLDILITGSNNASLPIAKLYINDGNGNYSKKTGTPFVGVTKSSAAFTDIDGNGTQDVLIAGFDGTGASTKLYTNDGDGNFTEVTGANLIGVSGGDVAFADLDDQNGPDILFTGINGNTLTTEIYINNGDGTFTNEDEPFSKLNRGAIAFADVDGNNTLDVVLTGIGVPTAFPSQTPVARTEIYLNDGNASFTQLSTSTFEGVLDSDAAFADVNGDGFQDLLIAGFNESNQAVTKLYINDESANFTESSEVFEGVRYSSIAFADVKEDSDNDLDIVISGEIGPSNYVTKLYTNDGDGLYTEVTSTPFTNTSRGAVAFLDIDNDNDNDLVLSGQKTDPFEPTTEVYSNDGAGNFILATGTVLAEVSKGASAFADVDGDGTEDLLITGENKDGNDIATLYTNDGNGNFSKITGTPFTGVETSAIAFADVDGANGPDVLISGYNGSLAFSDQYSTSLYTNNGNLSFTKVASTPFVGLRNGSIAFADVDGQNGQDVVITGEGPNTSFAPVTKLYTQNASGVFGEELGTPFEGIRNSSIVFGDMDGNGSSDLIISGEDAANNAFTALYLNDNGNFTLSAQTFEGVKNGAIAVGDTNGDAILDLLVTGTDNVGDPVAVLYTNNGTAGNPVFTAVTGTPFEGVTNSAVAIADIDGENGNDIIISGENSSGNFITKLYIQETNGDFSEVSGLPFDGISESDLSISDIDGDGLLDVLITGRNNSGVKVSKLYRNITDFVPPSITSPNTATVAENTETSFYTATANEEVSFSLGSGKDEALFSLEVDAISFLSPPDFETPLDADGNNVYLVDVIATDLVGNEVTQEVAITVTDVDESGPVITSSAAVTVEENVTGTVYTATADVAVTFTIGSNKDEAAFTLATDAISFNNPPDFETPLDADGNNVYQLDLIATDASGESTTKAISITVTDVEEEPLSTTDELLGKIYPNPVRNTLYVQGVDITIDASVRIMDLSGRLQKTIDYNGKDLEIDVSELNAGVYLLIVKSNSKQMQLKFVKE